MSGRWNSRHSAVKRIQQELKELQRDDDPDILAEAIEENIFEWHFVIRGAWDSEFEGGIYHGRILMPAEYPFKPPAFVMLTPSGRFETGVKICLSISSHHPESWQPSWSVRSALVALIAFMQTPGNGALGSLDHPADLRRQMAAESRTRPPAYGTEERQALIADMHRRMLDMEERSRAVCRQERAADSPASEQDCAADSPASVPAAAVSTTAGAPDSQANAPQQQQPQLQAVCKGVAESAGSATAALEAAAVPSPPAVAPHTPAEPESRQRAAAAAANPVAQPVPVPVPMPPAAAAAAVVQQGGHRQSWEDRGLTYLAVLLALCIAALLVRKVVVAFSFTSDELYNFNHVEGVEL